MDGVQRNFKWVGDYKTEKKKKVQYTIYMSRA